MEKERTTPSRESNPLVSILVLAYNHGPFIRDSILSLLAQRTAFAFEILIGEDCSTDDTREIVEQLAATNPEKIRLFTGEKNIGALANWNRIEEAAKGRYVAYCDGDDYWHDPDKLSMQAGFLEAHPDYVMTHTDYRILTVETGRITPRAVGVQDCLDDSDAYAQIIGGRRRVGTLTVCLRRSALDVARLQPECHDTRFLMGDTQRWLEITRLGKVRYFPAVTATRRVLAESATRSRNPDRVLRFKKSARDVLEHYIGKYPPPAEAIHAARLRSAMSVLRYSCATNDHEEARSAWRDLLSLGGSVPWLAHVYYTGSASPGKRRLLFPVIRGLEIMDSLANRLHRRRLASRHLRPDNKPA